MICGFHRLLTGLQVDDNIPLRVMLLLMDEVFDLKEKNQWLRRNIKNLLQQLIRATYGDTINRSGHTPHTRVTADSGFTVFCLNLPRKSAKQRFYITVFFLTCLP